jgi:triosephosphate isomerase
MNKSRGVLIAGNWKMNHLQAETKAFFEQLRSLQEKALSPSDHKLFHNGQLEACVIPPWLSIETARDMAWEFPFPIAIAGQNAHWEKKGAFTGEVCGGMLQEMSISWVLIGHSERRQYFGETDETVRKRTESLLEQGFRVIACVGETRAERDAGKTREVLTRQINAILAQPGEGATKYLDGKLVIAYEPVWAIGTGLTATPAQAQEAHALIRDLIRSRCGNTACECTQILYGGSVTPENIDSLLACADVDGALVGGASLKPESYLSLLVAGAKAVTLSH